MMNIICIIAVLYFAVLVSVVCTESVDRTGVRGAAIANENHNLGRQLQPKSIGFKLANASTGKVINNLEDGDVVNIGSNAPNKMTIEVVVSGYDISSVKITLSGASYIQKVESGTYALCGNMGTKLFPCPDFKLGKYNVKAELYTGLGATGTMVESDDVDFELIGMIQVPVAVPFMVVTTQPTTKAPVMAGTTQPPTKAPVMVVSSQPPTKAPVMAVTTQPTTKAPTKAPAMAVTTQPTTKAPAMAVTTQPTTKAPVMAVTTQPTTKAPVMAVTTKPTTKAPVMVVTTQPPTKAPEMAVTTKPPTKAPVMAATTQPTTKAPVMAVTSKPPTKQPAMAPVDPASCSVPKLVGSWEKWPTYPLNVAESMGGMVGDDFMVFSGFEGAWTSVTKSVYAYNVKDPNGKWDKMDDVPVSGFTHAAFAINGTTVYICGSYVGGTPGPDSNICLMYNHTASPGSKWTFLPQLPDGRGGGGMTHIKETNSLVYSTGSTRRSGKTIDHTTTWELELDLQSGWVQRLDCLYTGNHVSHVTAYYKDKPHYYWAGGQLEQDEEDGNQNDLVEWDQASKTWTRRANMKKSRGHASSSTITYGCGFLMIGGAVNGGKRTTDISWYSIEKDSWTKIGDLKSSSNTPVCDIVRNLNGTDWIYCQTGLTGNKYSWKSKISL